MSAAHLFGVGKGGHLCPCVLGGTTTEILKADGTLFGLVGHLFILFLVIVLVLLVLLRLLLLVVGLAILP